MERYKKARGGADDEKRERRGKLHVHSDTPCNRFYDLHYTCVKLKTSPNAPAILKVLSTAPTQSS